MQSYNKYNTCVYNTINLPVLDIYIVSYMYYILNSTH